MRKASICLVSVFCLAVYSASCNYHWKNLGIKESALFESGGGIFNDSLAERLCEQPYIQDKIRLIESFLTQALCTNNKIENRYHMQ